MKRFVPFLLYFFQLLITFILLEFVSGYFFTHTKNPLYRARAVLQVDPVLGWRQQPSLKTKFEAKSLFTDTYGFRQVNNSETVAPDQAELITLGPSSAFGWGVEATETYTALAGKGLELLTLNASQIGFAANQGERLYNAYLTNLPQARVALIAYGVNDLDKFRFFARSFEKDADFFKPSPLSLSFFEKIETHSAFFSLLSLAGTELGFKLNCSTMANIQQRASIEDYLKSIKNLVVKLRSQNIKPVLVNTPFFLKNPNPDYSFEKIDSEYMSVQKAAAAGHCAEALAHLQNAKSFEPDRVYHDVALLNESLKSFALAEHIPYINAYELLSGPQTEANFVDPVHPSAAGHEIISRQIIKTVMEFKNER